MDSNGNSERSRCPEPCPELVPSRVEGRSRRAVEGLLRHRRGQAAVRLGLISNIFLAALKTAVGVLGHSPALLADGINSTSDVAYYLVVMVFMRLSRKPPDQAHPYGHSQLESIASLVVGAFVVTTAVSIFWDGVNTVYDLLTGAETIPASAQLALWIALFTVLLKIGLAIHSWRVGRQTSNTAVLALAYDHRNDIFSAGAATVGILLGQLGYTFVDPLAGAIVALIVLGTGIQIIRESTDELMDTLPGDYLNCNIDALIAGIEGVIEVEDVRGHRFGPYLVLNVTIGVNGEMSVSEGDAIATQVEEMLRREIDYVRDVYVHYHPAVSVDTARLSSSD
jgi:cation diffusion facilitator family transporter